MLKKNFQKDIKYTTLIQRKIQKTGIANLTYIFFSQQKIWP